MKSKLLVLILLLQVTITKLTHAQIVSGNAFLQGKYVEVGIGPCGTYGSSVDAPSGYHPRGNGPYINRLGFIADPKKDGWNVGTPNYCGDYFVPGTPEEGFGIQINGINYNNNMLCGESAISGSVTDYRISGTNIIGTWQGQVAGVQITSVTTVPLNDVFFITEVTLKNTTGSTLNDIYFMRNVDPDNEVTLPDGSYTTNNTIVAQNPNVGSRALVSATGLSYGCYLGLGTLDCRARVTFGGFSNRDPSAVWNGTGGLSQSGSTTGDVAISLAFKINSLAPGETTSFKFAHVLSAADLERALNLTVPSLTVNGIAVGDKSTVNTCPGVAVPIQITNGSSYNWKWSPATGLNTTSGSSVTATVSSLTTYTASGVNSCGSNVSLTVTLNPTLSSGIGTVGAISGPTSICLPSTNQTYSVTPVTNATEYEWNVPSGVSIVGGDKTNTVTVAFSTPFSGNITVRARNGCGVSNTSTLAISGSTTNKPKVTYQNITVTADPGKSGANVTYPDPKLESGTPVTISYSPVSGSLFPIGVTTVTATATNSCGTVKQTFTVTVNKPVEVNVYYSKPTGDLHNTATWGVNPDGSGTNPSDFGAGKTFNLANRTTNYTMTGNWTVGGLIVNPSGSRLVINGFALSEAGISGAGTISGSTTSTLIVTGVSGAGVLNFTTGANSLKNLTINNSASATLGTPLNLYGVLTVQSGMLNTGNQLTLKSTATATAIIAPVTGTISGATTAERFIPARRAWRLINAPVTGSQTINQAWQEGVTTASPNPNPNPGFGTHITGGPVYGSTANGFDQNPGSNSSLLVYSTATNSWNAIPNTNATIANNKPYMLFVRGDRGLTLDGTTVPPTNTVLRTKGALLTGNQTFAVNATGFTAIPNPFVSPINFATLTRSNVQNSFYVWDPKMGGTYGVGAYVTVSWNGSSYDVTPAPVSPESQYIQPWQSFLVRSTGNAGVLTIKESDKVMGPINNVYSTAASNDAGLLRTAPATVQLQQDEGSIQSLRVNLKVAGDAADATPLDEVLTTYSSEYSSKVDRMDAEKMMNIGENLALIRESRSLAIERRNGINTSDTIYLKLDNMAQRSYVFNVTAVNLSPAKYIAFLEDKYLHTATPVSLSDVTQIRFSINEDAVSQSADRFRIILTTDKSQRSSFTDNAQADFLAYPNPIRGNTINLQLMNQPKGTYRAALINEAGQVMYNTQFNHAGGSATKTLRVNSKLAQGVYQLQVSGPSVKSSVKVTVAE